MKKVPLSSKNKFYEIINTVVDPDIGVGIADMGLIYRVTETNKSVLVEMTLTSMGCPAGPQLIDGVREAVETKVENKEVHVTIVWDPPWSPEMMKKELREMLFGNFGR